MRRTPTRMLFSLVIATVMVVTLGCENVDDTDPTDTSTTTQAPTTVPGEPAGDATDLIMVFHAHLAKDWMPYTTPALEELDEDQTGGMVDLLEETTALLEANGAVANIHFSYGLASALCASAPELLDQLAAGGHEIGIHTHGAQDVERAVTALAECDIEPTSASGMAFDVARAAPGDELQVAAEWLETQEEFGITTVTASIGQNRGGLADVCADYDGATFDALAGTIGQAWSPDPDDFCADSDGSMTVVPHASGPSATDREQPRPGGASANPPFSSESFDLWLPQLDAALDADLSVWGLVVAFATLTEEDSVAAWLAGLEELFVTFEADFDSGELVSVTASENAEK